MSRASFTERPATSGRIRSLPANQFAVEVAPTRRATSLRSASRITPNDSSASCAVRPFRLSSRSATSSAASAAAAPSPAASSPSDEDVVDDHSEGGGSMASRSRIRSANAANGCRIRSGVITSTTKILNQTTDNPTEPNQPKPQAGKGIPTEGRGVRPANLVHRPPGPTTSRRQGCIDATITGTTRRERATPGW